MHPRRLTAILIVLAGPVSGCFEDAPAIPRPCLPDADGLLNADFDCDPGSEVALHGWSLLEEYATGAMLERVADPEGAGSATAQLTSSDPGWHAATQVIEAPALQEQVLRLSGRVRLEGEGVSAGLSLYLEGEQGTVFFAARSLEQPLPETWFDLRTLALPYDARADRLRLVLWIEGEGRAWFDDLVLAPSARDRLEDFEKTCQQAYECGEGDESCQFGRCVPDDVLVGELAAPDEAARMQALDSVWSSADALAPGFVARPELDWDEAYERYREQMRDAESLAAWGGALTRMIGELRDSHGYLYLGGVNYSALSAVIFSSDADIACTTRTLDDRIAVYRVVEDNPLDLQVGDEILGFDGRDWQELDAEIRDRWERYTPMGSATPNQTTLGWVFPSSILYNRWFFHETVEIRRAEDGRVDSLPLQPAADTGSERIHCFDRPGFTLPAEEQSGGGFWRNPVLSGLIADGQVIYAAVRGMSTRTQEDTEALLQDHPDTAGMIWDVRLNGGGINEAGAPIWEALMDGGESIHTSSLLKRAVLGDTDRENMVKYMDEWIQGRSDRSYGGKVAVLTGPNSVSAADTIPWMLSHLPKDRLRIFGLPTNGSFSGYFVSEGSSTRIPVEAGEFSDYFSFVLPNFVMADAADGRILLGTDPEPDTRVWLSVEGLAGGRDDVVDAAVAWILE